MKDLDQDKPAARAKPARRVSSDAAPRVPSGRMRTGSDGDTLRGLNEALNLARADADEKEARLRLTLRAAEIGTFDFDPATGTLTWDDRCRELFGIAPGEPVSYEGSYLAYLHPEDREMADAAVAQALAPGGSGAFDVEYRTIGRDDGVLRWIAAKGSMIRVAGGDRFVGTVRDITRRKLADARVRETEERYRLASRATNDAIWDWDLQTDQVLWNEALTTAHGHRLDEIETTGAWWVGHIHPDDRDRVAHGIHAVIDSPDGTRWTDEYRFLRQDGGYASIQDRGFVLRDASGRAVRMVGAMLDVTERQRAAEQQRLLMNELQHRVKNTLAMVQAIASQTFRDSTGPEAREAFTNRVIALSHANDVLTQADWDAAPIEAVVIGATIPHCAPAERFDLSGPSIEIAARAALALTLALHELCTNAAKYGALSTETGKVAIRWEVDRSTFRLRWAETGGPPVAEPSRTGFGSRLIARSLGPQFGGEVTTDFDPGGVTCTFTAPLAAIQDAAPGGDV